MIERQKEKIEMKREKKKKKENVMINNVRKEREKRQPLNKKLQKKGN